jgi:hypothetical protein
MEDQEFGNLIGSDKVEGTAVYGADGEKIGSIQRLMIDKKTGQVSYAVLGFGGFLGMGSDLYPLSWSTLKYNVDLGGYQVAVTQEQLTNAPKYTNDKDWNWNEPEKARAVDTYYENVTGTPPANPTPDL